MLPPFFIVGAPRSGTTLLATILDSHSRIGVYRESHYYPLFRPNLHHYGDLGRSGNLRRLVVDVTQMISTQSSMKVPPTPEEFLEALVAPTFEGVFATILKLHARQHGKLHSGEKTPGHHAYLDEILEKFPQSPVIFVMRDPRDCILSMRKALGMSLRGAASEWNAAFISYQKASGRVHLLRYEEFVAKPEERSAELLRILGETYEPEVLHYFDRMRKGRRVPAQHRKLLEPVDPTNIGRFRQMPQSEIEWIESSCASGMETLGYEFAFGKPGAGPMIQQSRVNYYLDRLRFYGLSPWRWQRGLRHWKHVLRLRARDLLSSTTRR